MELQERLNADLKTALLSRDSETASTLRMVKSELQNIEISQGEPLTEQAIIQVLRKEVKKRNDAIELFNQADKPELAQKEKTEAEFLSKYLPAQIDPTLVENFIREYISSNPEAQKGEIIKEALSNFQDQTDGKTVSGIVNKLTA